MIYTFFIFWTLFFALFYLITSFVKDKKISYTTTFICIGIGFFFLVAEISSKNTVTITSVDPPTAVISDKHMFGLIDSGKRNIIRADDSYFVFKYRVFQDRRWLNINTNKYISGNDADLAEKAYIVYLYNHAK